MLQTRPLAYVTPQEYEQGELLSEIRHEYLEGQIFAMAGASERHGRIGMNIGFQLRAAARAGPCGVFVNDMKVRIREGERFYYPDVVLICDQDDDHEYHKDRPCLIAEVLLDSTEKTDRREKWAVYREIPSLRYYLLVDSREPRVEVYRRSTQGDWEVGTLCPGERLDIECPPAYHAEFAFEDVYEDLRWDKPQAIAPFSADIPAC